MGSLPNGFYSFVGDTLQIVTALTDDDRKRLTEALNAARQSDNPRIATEAILNDDPRLRALADRLLPRDPAQFWAMVMAILAALTLLMSQTSDKSTTITENTIIQHMTSNCAPAVPVGSAP